MGANNSVHKVMLDSDNYSEENGVQQAHALEIFSEYAPKMFWKNGGQDTILDIGCAGGIVTTKVLEPLLPKDYKLIVGIDVNEELIKNAQINNKNDRIVYKVMDISGDINLDIKEYDHITSFLCLHWVDNKKKAFENIYNLLAEGGDCLFTLATNHNYQKVTKIMSLMDQWKYCFKDYDLNAAPFNFELNWEGTLSKMIKDLGFKYHKIETKYWTYDHGDMESFRAFVKLFNPIENYLNEEEYEKYIDTCTELTWILNNDHTKRPVTHGDFITIYARK